MLCPCASPDKLADRHRYLPQHRYRIQPAVRRDVQLLLPYRIPDTTHSGQSVITHRCQAMIRFFPRYLGHGASCQRQPLTACSVFRTLEPEAVAWTGGLSTVRRDRPLQAIATLPSMPWCAANTRTVSSSTTLMQPGFKLERGLDSQRWAPWAHPFRVIRRKGGSSFGHHAQTLLVNGFSLTSTKR